MLQKNFNEVEAKYESTRDILKEKNDQLDDALIRVADLDDKIK